MHASRGSFRDPSGFIFNIDGIFYRQVNHSYRDDFDRLIASGLYDELREAGLLLEHTEVGGDLAQSDEAYKIIRPEQLAFVSYPYEWSFGQLKDAALLTLDIQRRALERGMSLKDASAYNVQFVRGRPMLIDTLSFESYRDGAPWAAYRQFCQHFLAPLTLMSRRDVSLGQLSRIHIDGIPLELASKLLPARTKLDFSIQLHIHAHARMQRKYADRPGDSSRTQRRLSRRALANFIESLRGLVARLAWTPEGTTWSEYYQGDSYDEAGLEDKKRIVEAFLDRAAPASMWDLGANTGLHSRLASRKGIFTVAWDIDPAAVELNYRQVARDGETHLLPLILDLTNPSAAIGWANEERMSLRQRGPADAVMALALVHHLAIANNVPLPRIAEHFGDLGRHLIIEFVPKTDPKVRKLLASREDIFSSYTLPGFEEAFGQRFRILSREQIQNSDRHLFLMAAK